MRRRSPALASLFVVLSAAGCVLGVPGSSTAGEPIAGSPALQVGPRQTLLENGALGLSYFPDMGTSVISPPPRLKLVLTATRSSYLVTGPDLEHLDSATEVLAPGPAGSYDNGYAGISAVVAVGGTLYGFYHAEDQEDLPGLPSGVPGFYATVGVASSTDGGATWIKHGPVIVSSKDKSWEAYPDQGDRGAGEPGAIVTRDGRYVLLYYSEHSRVDGRGVDIDVARADLTEGPPLPGHFQKYHDGSFSEPGVGGLDTPVMTGDAWPETNALEGHVVWSRAAGQYVMVFGVDAWGERTSGEPASISGIYYALSVDGVAWSQPRQLVTDQAIPQTGESLSWEASILWDDARGDDGWLVYGYSPSWGTVPHYLVGRRITWQ